MNLNTKDTSVRFPTVSFVRFVILVLKPLQGTASPWHTPRHAFTFSNPCTHQTKGGSVG
jgi:hypothetical protein